MHPGKIVSGPELGNVTYGHVITMGYDCGDPYMISDCVSVVDYWPAKNTHADNARVECVTTEGGVWKGTSENDGGDTVTNTYLGEGKYKGLKLTYGFDATTSMVEYRVTRVAEE